jgi:putative peptide-modifying radical SAM enzyme
MYYYLTLTLNCNLRCRYCYGKCVSDFGQPFPFEVEELPTSVVYGLDDLANFLGKDPEPIIIFYGGEPTLILDKIREVMDMIPAKAYLIQTNGLLIHMLETEYLNRFQAILVSIDGDEALTDYYRGEGTYRKIIENLKLMRQKGFRGEIIARMTVGPETDLYKAAKWLLFNSEFRFDSVHWQLDAQFWRSDYEEGRVRDWFRRYNESVIRLVNFWVSHIEAEGRVLRLYPFVGVLESLLTGQPTKLRCGAGWKMFNIQTNGKITPCPVMAGIKSFYLGDIWRTHPLSLEDSISVKEPCPDCKLYEVCGGRCLYANVTKLWGEEGYRLVCGTVENLVLSLEAASPSIRRLISEGRISIKSFNYPKFNSCEIIP